MIPPLNGITNVSEGIGRRVSALAVATSASVADQLTPAMDTVVHGSPYAGR